MIPLDIPDKMITTIASCTGLTFLRVNMKGKMNFCYVTFLFTIKNIQLDLQDKVF